MYIPSHFQLQDRNLQLDFIRQYGFGDLITSLNGQLEINHAPFLVDDTGNFLHCHLAKANQHWQSVTKADDLIVCFKGPDAYISAGWYTDQENVPTWNFVSLQVRGKAQLMDDAELVDLLGRLSEKHEAQFPNPWTMAKLSQKKLTAMLKAIVGIKIAIEHIDCKMKLSQNKSVAVQQELMSGLADQKDAGSAAILQLMCNAQKS